MRVVMLVYTLVALLLVLLSVAWPRESQSCGRRVYEIPAGPPVTVLLDTMPYTCESRQP